MITVTVRFFASIRDITNTELMSISLPEDSSLQELRQKLICQFPEFEKWKEFVRFAINHNYREIDFILNDKDEIAVIPPVSGG